MDPSVDPETSALIASLIYADQQALAAQYNPYDSSQYEVGDDGSDPDDDYVPDRIKKQYERTTTAATSSTNRPVATKTKNQKGGDSPSRKRKSADSKKQVKKKPKSSQAKAPPESKRSLGAYNPKEQAAFKEALERYGRDWKKISEHVATRDKVSIRLYAQKYFVKLYIAGIELPAKVLETGAGYTITGKPLDHNSAVARQLLKSKHSRDAAVVEEENSQQSPPKGEGSTANENEGDDKDDDEMAENEEPEMQEDSKPTEEAPETKLKGASKQKATRGRNTPQKKKKSFRETDLGVNIAEVMNEGITLTRAKTRSRVPRSLAWKARKTEQHPFRLLQCEHFAGEPVSSPSAQPFHIKVSSNVVLVMDFHAHLANTEIIGFLGGHWDPVSRVIHVVEAFPTASESTGQDSVEMDPASELEVRETMKVRGMKVVGWYHSHPHFEPTPSVRDVENQTNYQLLFRWEGENKSEEGRDGVDKERKGSEAASNVGGGIGVGDSDGDNDDDTQGTFVRLVVPVHPILLRPSQLAESLNQNAHYTPDHARGSLVPASPSKSDSDTNAIEPFIGAIVGTYDIRLPSAKSIISWFNVKRGKPMCLEYVLVEDEAISAHVEKALLDLISHLGFRDQRAVNCRVDFASLWRYAKVQSSNNTAVATTITTEKKEDQGEESRRRSKRKGKNKKKNKAEASIEKRGSAGVIVAGEEDHSSLGGDIVGAVVLMKQTTAGGEQEEGKATSGSLGVEEEEHDVPEEGKAERKEKDILLTREESYKEEPNAKQSEVEQKEGSEEEEESEEEESEESEEEETPGWTLQPVTKFEKFIEAMKHRLPQQYNQLQVSSFLRQVVDELSRVGWSLPSSSQLPAACPYAPISPSSAASSSSTSTSEEGKQSSNASILK